MSESQTDYVYNLSTMHMRSTITSYACSIVYLLLSIYVLYIALCLSHDIRTALDSHSPSLVYKWVPANLMPGIAMQWTSIPSRGE